MRANGLTKPNNSKTGRYMSIIRSIWNGPFHVGKLAQPISVGDVLLKILEVLWRLVISIIALGLSIAGYAYYVHPKLFPPIEDSITAEAFYSAYSATPAVSINVADKNNPPAKSSEAAKQQQCPSDFPVRVTFYNNGSKAVKNIRFELEGFLIGYSTNRLQYQPINNDRILPAGYNNYGCYAVRTEQNVSPDQLYYRVNIWSVSELEQ